MTLNPLLLYFRLVKLLLNWIDLRVCQDFQSSLFLLQVAGQLQQRQNCRLHSQKHTMRKCSRSCTICNSLATFLAPPSPILRPDKWNLNSRPNIFVLVQSGVDRDIARRETCTSEWASQYALPLIRSPALSLSLSHTLSLCLPVICAIHF